MKRSAAKAANAASDESLKMSTRVKRIKIAAEPSSSIITTAFNTNFVALPIIKFFKDYSDLVALDTAVQVPSEAWHAISQQPPARWITAHPYTNANVARWRSLLPRLLPSPNGEKIETKTALVSALKAAAAGIKDDSGNGKDALEALRYSAEILEMSSTTGLPPRFIGSRDG